MYPIDRAPCLEFILHSSASGIDSGGSSSYKAKEFSFDELIKWLHNPVDFELFGQTHKNEKYLQIGHIGGFFYHTRKNVDRLKEVELNISMKSIIYEFF